MSEYGFSDSDFGLRVSAPPNAAIRVPQFPICYLSFVICHFIRASGENEHFGAAISLCTDD
jgi:hypothetical protein